MIWRDHQSSSWRSSPSAEHAGDVQSKSVISKSCRTCVISMGRVRSDLTLKVAWGQYWSGDKKVIRGAAKKAASARKPGQGPVVQLQHGASKLSVSKGRCFQEHEDSKERARKTVPGLEISWTRFLDLPLPPASRNFPLFCFYSLPIKPPSKVSEKEWMKLAKALFGVESLTLAVRECQKSFATLSFPFQLAPNPCTKA